MPKSPKGAKGSADGHGAPSGQGGSTGSGGSGGSTGKSGKGAAEGTGRKAEARTADRPKSARGAGPSASAVTAASAPDAAKAAKAARVAEKTAEKIAEKAAERAARDAEAAKPKVWPKGGPSKADLKRYRQALLDLRRALFSSSTNLANEALKASGQDFSVDHMADHGSDNYDQDFSLKLLEGESEQLADIREALLKIDGKLDVPFGICEACTDEPLEKCESCPWIPASRLDVLPHAKLCVQTKEMQERGRLS